MTATSWFTAEQLLALPSGMGKRYELVAGELVVMSPPGWRHGNVVGNLHSSLGSSIRKRDLGLVFGAETGFRLGRNPDTVRAPDIAFIAKHRLPSPLPHEAYWPGAPDLAVEVLSPDDRSKDVADKVAAWLTAGTRAVWIVDPKRRTVTIHESGCSVRIFKTGDTFDGGQTIPDFSCTVDELFP